MNCRCSRFPVLLDIYQRYLLQANMSDFKSEVSRCYTAGTLERLVSHSDASVRRAAVLALGSTGEMSSVRILVSALRDADRTVAILAEKGGSAFADHAFFAPRVPIKPVAISAIVAAEEAVNAGE